MGVPTIVLLAGRRVTESFRLSVDRHETVLRTALFERERRVAPGRVCWVAGKENRTKSACASLR